MKYYLNMGNYNYHDYYDGDGVLSFSTVEGYIYADYPIIAGCHSWIPIQSQPGEFQCIDEGHMVVYRGVTAAGRITVNDPLCGLCYAEEVTYHGGVYISYEGINSQGHTRNRVQDSHIKYDVSRGE